MITRFDHAVIAVHALDAAMRAYERLGFTVSRGGRHPGRGTENAIVRFGLEYLELLALADEAEARASGWDDAALQSFAHGGFLDFALASSTADDLAADVERLRGAGLAVAGPVAGSRRRPDGTLLEWQMARIEAGIESRTDASGQQAAAETTPRFAHHREPWPFLIQWRTPDAERLAGDVTGPQPNGLTGVSGVAVIVRDLDAAIAVYQQGLGLRLLERSALAGMGAERARFVVGAGDAVGENGNIRLDLLAPRGEGIVARALAERGEGLFSVLLAAPDLEATRVYLARSGVPTRTIPGRADELLIAPEAAAGARLVVRAGE